MASIHKCPQCGLDLSSVENAGRPNASSEAPGARIWWGAAIQFGICAVFMVVFKFPRFMIAVFGGFILLGTLISSLVKSKALTAVRTLQKPPSRPTLYRILGLAVTVCSLAFLCVLLFGSLIFLNAWSRWHLYQGQPFHRSEFHVTRVYFQKLSRGSDVYASGTVDGNREWMNLVPYLQTRPADQAELESRVPPGTTIPIYLYSDLQGRSRVQIFGDLSPAEAYRRSAINAVNYGLCSLAVLAGCIFVLTRARRGCFVEELSESSYPEAELLKL